MSTVTQRISNLYLGISQQPDTRKFPGQVRDAVNTFPDFALGMLKRPGGQYKDSLLNATTTGRWFSILRDNNEKYIAQYANNIFRVWSLANGNPHVVDMGTNTGVPGTCNITNTTTALNNYTTAKALTATRLASLHAAQATYSEILAGQTATEIELYDVRYNYTNGTSVHDAYMYSGITLNSGGYYTVKDADSVVSIATTLPAGYRLGSENTDEEPKIASQGLRVFSAIKTVAALNTASELSTAETAMNTAQTNYNSAVSDEATKLGLYQTQVSNCAVSATPSNGYLYGATPEDIEVLTLNDYTFVLNKKKTVAMDATTTAASINEAMVVIAVVANSTDYKVVLDGTTYTYNSGTNANADGITNGLQALINGVAGFSATVVGPSIYITKSSSFTIETRGSTTDGGLYAFQQDVNTVSALPTQAKNGYLVRVVNASDINIDDMWLKFETSSGGSYGVGTWTETVGPGLEYRFNPLTMPHQLVRQTNGSFKFEPVTWDERVVGDNTTNPVPSFVGNTIKSMFLYRNRLGFLSNETVVLSRAGDLFNFFNTTALTGTDDDPIDISASTAKPVSLNYVKPASVGLVLFGETEQFLLSTDSDILSPKTAKINSLSSYECDKDVEAVSFGSSYAFIAKTALYTKVFDQQDVRNDSPPVMEELTNNVPELIPSTVDHFVASPALSLGSLGTIGSDVIYQYKFLFQQNRRAAQAWYKWKLFGTLLDQFFDQSTYYGVVANGSDVEVFSINLRQSSDTGFLTLQSGEKTDVCLDMWNVNPYRTYDSATDKTRIYLPFNHQASKTLSVVVLGGYINNSNSASNSSVGAVVYPTVAGSTGSYYADIDGDYRGRDLIIGYIYDMEIELPKFYVVKSESGYASTDQDADLIIHRLNVATGLSGAITYEIDLTGIPTWENTVNVTLPNSYVLNNVNMTAAETHVVPIYQRNKNTSIRLRGDTPFPVTIVGMTWEGRMNTAFYRRLN